MTLRDGLGRGGFANSAVYAAVSGLDNQPFAVKLLRIGGAEREQRLNAWSALIPLSHPNLIRIIEAGQCEIDGVSLLYLVMERADGDLAGVLEWAARVLPGRVMYELQGVDEKTAREAFRLAGHKLPVAYKFLTRGEIA